ncbi:MAG: TonB-dependent receptor, partial [Cytophagaceae bacterium]
FWKGAAPVMNYFKIRASWGQLGNDQIYLPGTNPPVLATYQYLATYGFNTYIINNGQQQTLGEARIPNPNITWEVANNADVGIEGQFFNGKISFEFDYFNNLRTSILYPRNASVPRTTGLTLPPENIGRVRNSGFDGQISYNGKAGDLRFSVGVNGGYAQNKILFWDEAPGAPDWQRTTGKPINTYIAYQYDGVFATQEEISANKLDYSAIVKTLRPGDMKYKDFDGDGKITPNDQVRNNRTNLPLFQGGMNITASYKNFDLTILFQGAAGAQQYISLGESGNIGNYLQEFYTDRWTVENPSSVHPRIANRSDQYFSGGNTYWLRSADYIRLKNFEVGYTIPDTFAKKIGISSLRIYANGLNLFNIVNNLGSFDPEADNATGQYYPQSRILNTGLTLRF